MRRPVLAALASAMISVGVVAAPGVTETRAVARGEFTVTFDLASVNLQPVGDKACKLTADTTLTFTGTLVGAAEGATVVLIAASCDDVATTPPGTFADVFTFVGDFAGTIDGEAAEAKLGYAGATRASGGQGAHDALARGPGPAQGRRRRRSRWHVRQGSLQPDGPRRRRRPTPSMTSGRGIAPVVPLGIT